MILACLRRIGLVLAVTVAAPASAGDQTRDIDRLIELLAFEETIGIMRDEGLRYGGELAGDMLPDADRESWAGTVARIYDADKMLRRISLDFHDELADADVTPMLAYFSGEDGQEVIALELAARRAFLDPETEAGAQTRFEDLKRDGSALVTQVEDIMAESDLVEFNVMGTLNSSLMFYRGLSDGGAYDISEDEMLADVWAQEAETRQTSRAWLAAFLTMAYKPLDARKLEDYAAFYRSPAGRELNRAIFASFDQMYAELSYLMGLAVAQHMASEPL